jgi:hypothetical protein
MATMREWQLAIVDRLAEVFPDNQVFEEGPPEEDYLPMYPNRMVKPYVIVWFGQRVDGGPGFNSVCGVLGSAHRGLFLVQVCAATGRMVNDAAAAVSQALIGFRPAGQGELKEDSAPTIRNPLDMSGVNTRYQVPLAYNGIVDF